jgi:lipase chaperone LimK
MTLRTEIQQRTKLAEDEAKFVHTLAREGGALGEAFVDFHEYCLQNVKNDEDWDRINEMVQRQLITPANLIAKQIFRHAVVRNKLVAELENGEGESV